MSDYFFVALDLEEHSLCVGLCFKDSLWFKQVIHSNTILHNFDIKNKVSNKSRVIATCTYHGCLWRIRASLCSYGHSFEVKKLHSTHICPGVNRARNKQKTTCCVAHEI
ncbi:hypothetical protein KFK09_017154 [Dendrobium nobile]|uniref:Transposase MuDR plant domain-containing protein n=1 Tax=Dendrobium nobile TaxID=94219 RepID=A0A8T3B1F2_DENNO|nr:hypothetical protein KFK09_017154 [Dendrobium nobile]